MELIIVIIRVEHQFAAKRRHALALIFESNLGFEQLVARCSTVVTLSRQASKIHPTLPKAVPIDGATT